MHVLISSFIAKCCTLHFGRLQCTYRKSTIKPSGGLIYFKHIWEGGGGLVRDRGLIYCIYLIKRPGVYYFSAFPMQRLCKGGIYLRAAFVLKSLFTGNSFCKSFFKIILCTLKVRNCLDGVDYQIVPIFFSLSLNRRCILLIMCGVYSRAGFIRRRLLIE